MQVGCNIIFRGPPDKAGGPEVLRFKNSDESWFRPPEPSLQLLTRQGEKFVHLFISAVAHAFVLSA